MDALFQLLGKLSPAALLVALALIVIGGLGYIIYMLVRQGQTNAAAMLALQSNHLHELPEMAETLRRMEQKQDAATVAYLGHFSAVLQELAYLRARVNGR